MLLYCVYVIDFICYYIVFMSLILVLYVSIENDTLLTTKRKKNDAQHEQEEETELERTDS